MKWRASEARRVPAAKAAPAAEESASGPDARTGGGRLQRAARRLRLSLSGARDDLGHSKHRRRWLAWELSD